jgi:hypothetical protein
MAQVPIEKPHYDIVGGARFRQFGIAEERVPHPVHGESILGGLHHEYSLVAAGA